MKPSLSSSPTLWWRLPFHLSLTNLGLPRRESGKQAGGGGHKTQDGANLEDGSCPRQSFSLSTQSEKVFLNCIGALAPAPARADQCQDQVIHYPCTWIGGWDSFAKGRDGMSWPLVWKWVSVPLCLASCTVWESWLLNVGRTETTHYKQFKASSKFFLHPKCSKA